MKDMNLNELTKNDLMELMAAVSFRVAGFFYGVQTFYYIYHFNLYIGSSENKGTFSFNSHTSQSYFMDILFHTLMTGVMFLLSVPLAKLVCRGLSEALELKLPN